MNNRFVILIGSYNNEQWVAQNLDSVLSQTYKNFKIIYYNAASTDKTGEIADAYAKKDSRINVVSSAERHLKSWFLANAEHLEDIKDNDIVCVLDGDDFLGNEDVLEYLNAVYNQTDCWMTYGGMIVWNGGDSTQEAFPQNSEAPAEVKLHKLYRKDLWRYSHFRTCRGFLWKRVNKRDLISSTDGQYMTLEDLVLMYAFLEMCPADKIFRVDQPIYIWNNSTAVASRGCIENKVNNIGQVYEAEIRQRPQYKEVSVVSPTLAGGLGNQMFEVAAAASLAKDNGALVVVNPTEHILPNQGRNVSTYVDNVFSRIALDKTPPLKAHYKWDKIGYQPIPFQPNLKLGGHYQSYKYFHHNQEYIKALFAPTKAVDAYITEKYGATMNTATAVQVRRGDYHKFPDHHPLLTPEYYSAAVKLANPSSVWVFSDDIKWCQENLRFDCPVQYVKEEDYIELYLMSFCKNVIISNSSFGWWAAYLNGRPSSKVFVPSTWFGPALIADGFIYEDLILDSWIRV
jgi:glycosyltransferase involved in cell wall biosynthesis